VNGHPVRRLSSPNVCCFIFSDRFPALIGKRS
jgi:hypothetical protein